VDRRAPGGKAAGRHRPNGGYVAHVLSFGDEPVEKPHHRARYPGSVRIAQRLQPANFWSPETESAQNRSPIFEGRSSDKVPEGLGGVPQEPMAARYRRPRALFCDRPSVGGGYFGKARLRRWLGVSRPAKQARYANASRMLFRTKRRRFLAWPLLTWCAVQWSAPARFPSLRLAESHGTGRFPAQQA